MRERTRSYDSTAERLIANFAWDTPLGRWGFDLLWANDRDRDGFFTAAFWLVPGPYEVFVHFEDPEEDPHDLAVRVLGLLDRRPADWPDVEWTARYDAPDRGPDLAGPGWRPRAER